MVTGIYHIFARQADIGFVQMQNDRNLNNYHGTDYYVDLVVATAGNGIAQCVAMLDDRP